jgi:hypothetical protein
VSVVAGPAKGGGADADLREVGADLVLQLHHEPLGELLADAGYRLELLGVAAHDGGLELIDRERRQDRKADLGAHAADADQGEEELALARRGEAEELQRVVAHVQVGLHGDLGAHAARERGQQRRRGLHGEADAARLDDGPVGLDTQHDATQRSDHARCTPASSLDVCR